jgi:acyl-CoA dehydrogenase
LFSLTAAEELLWGGSTGVVVGLQSLGIALPSILLLGTETQKQRWVPPILAGDKIAALGVTEPGAGSDVAGVQTTAVRDGDHYVLNGSKLFITSGVRADTVVILARTSPDRHGGLTFFVVERGTPGFGQSRALQKTGWWASDTAEISLADVRVPIDHRLGQEGSGFSTVMQTFVGERLFLSFLGHQTAHIVLQDALAYARERKVFGKHLAQFQLTRHKLAKMQTQVEVARRFNYSLAAQVQAGESPIAEVAMAKNFSADVAIEVSYEAVQLLGGMGYMRETRVERLSRDARLLPIGGGTSEIMNEIIAKTALNL